jgi:hypothetical protein
MHALLRHFRTEGNARAPGLKRTFFALCGTSYKGLSENAFEAARNL